MKPDEVMCISCGGEPMVDGMRFIAADGPFFVSCTGCDRITGAWYSVSMAWKEWRLLNQQLKPIENEKKTQKD